MGDPGSQLIDDGYKFLQLVAALLREVQVFLVLIGKSEGFHPPIVLFAQSVVKGGFCRASVSLTLASLCFP